MTRYTYGFSRDVELPFAEAVETTAAALQAEGFTVTPISSPAHPSLNGAERQSYVVMDVCHPVLLEQAMRERPDLALQTACRAVVSSREVGSTVRISDPYQSASATALPAIAANLNEVLWSAYLRIVLAAA